LNGGGRILAIRDINYKELFMLVGNGRTMFYVRNYYEDFTEFNNKDVKYIPFFISFLK
jgi:hypothetical protein